LLQPGEHGGVERLLPLLWAEVFHGLDFYNVPVQQPAGTIGGASFKVTWDILLRTQGVVHIKKSDGQAASSASKVNQLGGTKICIA
jgi:hypothetical protein